MLSAENSTQTTSPAIRVHGTLNAFAAWRRLRQDGDATVLEGIDATCVVINSERLFAVRGGSGASELSNWTRACLALGLSR